MENTNQRFFGKAANGEQADVWILRNAHGLEAWITNYGCRIVKLLVPGRDGNIQDVVVGFDSLEGYLQSDEPFHGTIVGRFANRIKEGKFTLDGKQYQLPINNGPNHLHGGPGGFHNRYWVNEEASDSSLTFLYVSPDMEEGYPGNLRVYVKYELSDSNQLSIHYRANTDAPTIINLTSHPFFNLNGQGNGDILDHLLQIHASTYNPVDKTLIPTGVQKVEGTPFDFRKPATIGSRIQENNDQLKYGGGYDHNFILEGSGLREAGRITGDKSGLTMVVYTDQPAMQLYSGNFMEGNNKIKYGKIDTYRSAFCLETQHYPDSPNHPEFPSVVLRPGQVFETRTIYEFV